MRIGTRRLLTVCGALLVACAALAGCAPTPGPAPPPSPSAATDTPVFASDQEALAAATEAYAAYLAAIDAVLAEGGADTSALGQVASGDALAAETKTANVYADQGLRSVGLSKFDSMRLRNIDDDSSGHVEVNMYLCSDVSAVEVVDASGASIVPSDRIVRNPLQVVFENNAPDSVRLVIASSEIWSGTNFC